MKYLISSLLIAFLISCGGGDKNKSPEKMDETHSQESALETPEASKEEEMTQTDEGKAMPETETKVDLDKKDVPKENKTEKKSVQTKNEWSGYVVNVGMASTSNVKKLSKAEAAEQLKNNQIIGFFSDGKVYLVYNTDGTYASRDLAKNANSDSFTIMGDMSNINGMNVIIAKSYK